MQDAQETAPAQAQGAKKTNPKREELKALSAPAKIAVAFGKADSINAYLIAQYRNTEGANAEFHTLHQWNKKGYKVTRGSKAFLVWGRPPAEQAKDNGQPQETEEDESKFFPICYLFSSNQVTPRDPVKS